VRKPDPPQLRRRAGPRLPATCQPRDEDEDRKRQPGHKLEAKPGARPSKATIASRRGATASGRSVDGLRQLGAQVLAQHKVRPIGSEGLQPPNKRRGPQQHTLSLAALGIAMPEGITPAAEDQVE